MFNCPADDSTCATNVCQESELGPTCGMQIQMDGHPCNDQQECTVLDNCLDGQCIGTPKSDPGCLCTVDADCDSA